MDNNLTFGKSQSIAAFKAERDNEVIKVIKNPQTDKLFFQCGSTIGAVSTKLDNSKEMQITEVATPEGVTFFLLCNAAQDNVLFTL